MSDLKEENKKPAKAYEGDKILELLIEEAKTTKNIKSLTKQIELRQKYLIDELDRFETGKPGHG